MLEATFTPLKPTDNSEDFYIDFYNLYSFIQVNDTIITFAKNSLSEMELIMLICNLKDYNKDHDIASKQERFLGINNPATNRRKSENRGLSTEWLKKLMDKGINPLDWYQKAVEFIMIYAACEQAIREFIALKGVLDNSKSEVNLIDELLKTLSQVNLKCCFMKEIEVATASIVTKGDQLNSLWRFYTIYRHAIAHAGGKNTEKIKSKMEKVIKSNKKPLSDVRKGMDLELALKYDDDFFTSPFTDEMISISDQHLSFYRNLSLYIVESLERILHPDDYKIEDLYK